MKKQFLKTISLLTHPVFTFPVLTMLYFEWSQINSFFVVFLLSFLAPFGYFLYLYKQKKISNFDVTDRKQRYPLYYATLTGLSISLVYLYLYSTPEIFQDFSRLIALAITIILFNFKIKVSLHAAILTVLCFSLTKDFNLTPAIFLLIPIVAYSRLALKKHSLQELILGVIIPTLFYIW